MSQEQHNKKQERKQLEKQAQASDSLCVTLLVFLTFSPEYSE